VIADLTEAGQRIRLARGGNGGHGNVHFKTATNQAPYFAMPGQTGEERWIWLRLKLIADAGLVGLPNAGKSTFLAATSAAKPKIADYPFTTLTPNLGIVDLSSEERFVLADIPGLIEGAHEGAGIGTRFLGHVERTAVLIHLVDGTQEDVAGAWRTVRTELNAYGEGLEARPELLALNKVDALDEDTRASGPRRWATRRGARPCWCPAYRRGRARGAARRLSAGPDAAGGGSRRGGRPGGARPLATVSATPHPLSSARRIVVKVGSALLVRSDTGEVDRAWVEALAADLARLRARGAQVLVVSSGAVALGRRRLRLPARPLTLPEKQAAAAAGQSVLMRAWEESLAPHGISAAQILLTRDDTRSAAAG
jgi:hypothetical protein